MTQIEAIEIAERALAKRLDYALFAIPFANRRDYDRVDDALTDMGCLTGEYVPFEEPIPVNPACRSIERLLFDFGPQAELFMLNVAVPGHPSPALRERRLAERS